MTDNEANELRLIANDIMYRLYAAGQRDQLHILHKYAERAVEEIDEKAKKQGTPNAPVSHGGTNKTQPKETK